MSGEIQLSSEQNYNYAGLLSLVRTLGIQKLSNSIQLNIIVNNIHDIIGTEDFDLDRVSIEGVTKVINQEYPQMNCRLIDADVTQK